MRPGVSSTSRVIVAALATALLVVACASGARPGWTYTPPTPPSGAPASAGASNVPAATPVAAEPTPTAVPEPTPTYDPALGFTPGTVAYPRVIEMSTDDQLDFVPGLIQAAIGETVTFRITNSGKSDHEFMIGPLADAFADKEGTPEITNIAPHKTEEMTFTFDGPGPYAFACHEPAHFEHGMAGYIQLVGPGAPTLGTKENPRVVGINMLDTLHFMPESVDVTAGETIRFVLTNQGAVTHEFQVGETAGVDADQVDGIRVVEADQIKAGDTTAIDYTFDGSGPYAYACHEPGHFESGMRGVINIKQT